MVLPVSGSQSFQECHREVCWVFVSSSYMPVICSSCYKKKYYLNNTTLLAVTPQTDLLSLPPFTGTWSGFRSMQSRCMILNPNKTKISVVSRSRTGDIFFQPIFLLVSFPQLVEKFIILGQLTRLIH